jgi:Zn-dependent protease with chaperone function
MKKRMSVVALVLLFILFSCFYARAEDEMQREIKFGKEVSEEIEQHWERVSDPVKIAHLSMICEKIKPHMTRTLPFEIRIIQEKSLNAFSLPGGIIYMTTGILDFLHSDAEIGAIIAHEMIHADRKHVMLQMAQSQRISIFALVLSQKEKVKISPLFFSRCVSFWINIDFTTYNRFNACCKASIIKLYSAIHCPMIGKSHCWHAPGSNPLSQFSTANGSIEKAILTMNM